MKISRKVSFCVCFLTIALLRYWLLDSTTVSDSKSTLRAHARDSSNSVTLQPSETVIEGVEIFWQLPDSPEPPKRALLFFHGCTHSGRDFFRLPEEQIVARKALQTGLAVFSFTSNHRDSGCWDAAMPPDLSRDAKVRAAFYGLCEQLGISRDELKTVAFGASSGGTFVSTLAHLMPLDLVVVHISPGFKRAFTAPDPWITKNFVFVYMSRDVRWATKESAESSAHLVQSHGGISKMFETQPKQITSAKFFHEKIESISLEQSEKIFEALLLSEWIDEDGNVLMDPRAGALREIEKQVSGLQLNTMDGLEEVLNACYGEHEMSAEHFDEILDWFLSSL